MGLRNSAEAGIVIHPGMIGHELLESRAPSPRSLEQFAEKVEQVAAFESHHPPIIDQGQLAQLVTLPGEVGIGWDPWPSFFLENTTDVEKELIPEQPAGRRIGAGLERCARAPFSQETGQERQRADQASAPALDVPDQVGQIGEIAGSPIAGRANGVRRQKQAPGLLRSRRLIGPRRSSNDLTGKGPTALSDCQAVVAERQMGGERQTTTEKGNALDIRSVEHRQGLRSGPPGMLVPALGAQQAIERHGGIRFLHPQRGCAALTVPGDVNGLDQSAPALLAKRAQSVVGAVHAIDRGPEDTEHGEQCLRCGLVEAATVVVERGFEAVGHGQQVQAFQRHREIPSSDQGR
jgi:hypothetical protein